PEMISDGTKSSELMSLHLSKRLKLRRRLSGINNASP
uniref:SOCS box domain-containing protein n=1 Tax=Parascaris univalens TaxID=6257 RepID=A0A915BX71_PARUN